jgi:putative GTP pyrophosphokinase
LRVSRDPAALLDFGGFLWVGTPAPSKTACRFVFPLARAYIFPMMRIPLPLPSYEELQKIYQANFATYQKALGTLCQEITDLFSHLGLKVTLKYRVKSLESLYEKAVQRTSGMDKGTTEFIPTDLMGLRVVCPFLSNVDEVERVLEEHFTVTERDEKGANLGAKEFYYESLHFLVRYPESIVQACGLAPGTLVEVQVRTLLQDAWAEVEHQLIYKSEASPLDEPMRRRLAALSANLSLSDIMFQEIRDYQNSLHGQLYRRRHDFWNKLNASYESPLTPAEQQDWNKQNKHLPRNNDQKLLEGLLAHNEGDYSRSIRIYTEILSSENRPKIRSIIHVHRGMAHFSQDNLALAMEDFTSSIGEDPKNPKGYLYRGLIHSLKESTNEALEDYAQALEYDPYSQDALLERAKLYYRLGAKELCQKDCSLILHINPEHGKAKELLEKAQK